MSTTALTYRLPLRGRVRERALLRRLTARPELLALLGVAAVLNLWDLSINGWANTYYAAAVRSMSTSWHDFLFASLDKAGLMTVDKPPLSLWIQALSVRVFGFHSLSILVPQALMGVAAAGLTYDLTARRFGRAAGFVAGLVLATTPVIVAVSRHNNPDELLVLCCVAALWAALRALDTGRTRWLVISGICVGLGFETKMLVAMVVVPGIAIAYLWAAPTGRMKALRQLLAGGGAMLAVAGAWPLLVTLTPASERPWISGTSDNSIWSLIFGYNGLGRVSGQSGGPGGGGPGGGGGSLFGGPTGPFRLLQSGLGDQAGWLLGSALAAGLALLVLTRLRRRDPRTGWLIAIGGAFLTTTVLFSFASGIFHPYYVSLLAPFAAALVGGGAGMMLTRHRSARWIAPLVIAGGAITELVVLGELNSQLGWAVPLVVGVGGACAVLLATSLSARLRAIVVAVALAALMAAPATWAAETVGHATSSTFPTGGPAGASTGAPGGAGPGGGAGPRAFGGGFGPPAGGFGGEDSSLTAAIKYAEAHGGGTIAVESQSSAASAILSSGARVAGLGGFSGRESSVSVGWLASEVASGHLRWVVADNGQGGGLPGDTRTGSQTALDAVAKACKAVTIESSSGGTITMYDCQGRAAAIVQAARG